MSSFDAHNDKFYGQNFDAESSSHGSYGNHHSNNKRYQCSKCFHRFTQKITCVRHMRYICGKPPGYGCPYCDHLATCSSNMYRHVRMRHKGCEVKVVRFLAE